MFAAKRRPPPAIAIRVTASSCFILVLLFRGFEASVGNPRDEPVDVIRCDHDFAPAYRV